MEFLQDLLADRRRLYWIGGGLIAIVMVSMMACGGSPPSPPVPAAPVPVATQPPSGSDAVAESWGMPQENGGFWLDNPDAYQGAQEVGD